MKRKGIDLDKTLAHPGATRKNEEILAEIRAHVPVNLPDFVNPAALYLEATYPLPFFSLFFFHSF